MAGDQLVDKAELLGGDLRDDEGIEIRQAHAAVDEIRCLAEHQAARQR